MRYFDQCYQLRCLTTATRDVVPFEFVLVSSVPSATTNDDVKPIQKIVTVATILRTDGFIIENLIVNRLSVFIIVYFRSDLTYQLGSDLRSYTKWTGRDVREN